MKYLLILASFLLMPQMAMAQTPVAIRGLQVIAERQYATDPAGSIDTTSKGVFLASARVYLFDSADDADTTWETLVAAESIENDLPDDGSVDYEKTEVDDVGDRATVITLNAEMTTDETGAFRTMIIQNDTVIVTVTVIAGSIEAAEIADTLAMAMIEREPGTGEAEYDGTGGSTGGVWEIFLPADAEELGELQAYADKETRPA